MKAITSTCVLHLRVVGLAVVMSWSVAVMPAKGQWWLGVPPEDVWLTQIGFAADLSMTNQGSDFLLPYAPTCCVSYGSSLNFGLAVSAVFRQEITKHLRLDVRGTYAPFSGTFETDEEILVAGNVNGLSRHTLTTTMTYVGAELLADVRLGSPLRLLLGGSVGSFIQAEYDQKETLVQPGTGTFENGMRERNATRNAPLQNLASPAVWLVGGLGFDIPLTENHSVMITPEVLYSIGMTDIVDGTGWSANMLRIGATVAFALNAPAPPLPQEYRRKEIVDSIVVSVPPDGKFYRALGPERIEVDTTVENDVVYFISRLYRTDTVFVPEKPAVEARIAVRSKEEDGSERNNFTIRVSTQFVTEALPLLPVVFFESQAISLSFRYHQVQRPEQFKIDDVPTRTTAVHREVMNILGMRMRANASSAITLRGNADPTTEGGNCDLARNRAQAVKDYLVQVWGIDPSRINVEERSGGCAPSRPTREQSEAGFSENRRVEIETTDLSLLAPVSKRRFNEARTVNPPGLVLDPSGTSSRYLTNWSMEAMAGQDAVFTRKGEGAPAPIIQTFSVASADMMKADVPLTVKLNVQALQGVEAQAQASITVVRDTLATEIERLTLTLFEVASDALTPIAVEQIRKFVEGVPPGSRVVVSGYADQLGNAEFNRKLSQRRADAVCAEIRRQSLKQVELECTEIATDRFPPGIESYDTPEQRFLSRTVQIEVLKKRV
jgi:outer membrane protein OmpA-like peptidoglycan-associated protein